MRKKCFILEGNSKLKNVTFCVKLNWIRNDDINDEKNDNDGENEIDEKMMNIKPNVQNRIWRTMWFLAQIHKLESNRNSTKNVINYTFFFFEGWGKTDA